MQRILLLVGLIMLLLVALLGSAWWGGERGARPALAPLSVEIVDDATRVPIDASPRSTSTEPRARVVLGAEPAAAEEELDTSDDWQLDVPVQLRPAPGARLVITITAAGGEPVGVRLVTTRTTSAIPGGQPYSVARSWHAVVEQDRTATIEGLPPWASLDVELRRAGELVRRMPNALSLEPDETREVTWSLAGARLRGRIVREDLSAVIGAPVWLLARDEEASIAQRLLSPRDERLVLAGARTDELGAFELEDLAPGRYWVGLAAHDAGEGDEVLLPLALAVEIGEHSGEEQVEIVLPAALHMSGRVVGADDEPAQQVFVWATRPGLRYTPTERTDGDGRFRAGPLPPGEYTLHVTTLDGPASEPVRARAGSDDVLIRLLAFGEVSGRVLDSKSGDERPAELFYSAAGGGLGQGRAPEGRFRLKLLPDTYALVAIAGGPRIGVLHPVVLDAHEQVEGLVLRLDYASHVRVRYVGETAWSQFRIRWKGQIVAGDGLRSGTEKLAVVPLGPVVVELHLAGELIDSRAVTTAIGEITEVLFDQP